MPAGEDGDKDAFEHRVLTDDDAADLVKERLARRPSVDLVGDRVKLAGRVGHAYLRRPWARASSGLVRLPGCQESRDPDAGEGP